MWTKAVSPSHSCLCIGASVYIKPSHLSAAELLGNHSVQPVHFTDEETEGRAGKSFARLSHQKFPQLAFTEHPNFPSLTTVSSSTRSPSTVTRHCLVQGGFNRYSLTVILISIIAPLGNITEATETTGFSNQVQKDKGFKFESRLFQWFTRKKEN